MRTHRRHTLEQLESREMPSGVTSDACVYAAGTARTAALYNLDGMVEFEVVPYGDGFSGGVGAGWPSAWATRSRSASARGSS